MKKLPLKTFKTIVILRIKHSIEKAILIREKIILCKNLYIKELSQVC